MRFFLLRFCCVALTVSGVFTVGFAEDEPEDDSSPAEITWTEVPKVDRSDPEIQRGIVFGPDGKPVEGAEIFAASNIELFEIQAAQDVSIEDLGEVRAVTDSLGRYEFRTPDLTFTTIAGERKRWEAYLVATKQGLAPGWIKTFGNDRGLRSSWHPHINKEVAIRMMNPADVSGSILSPDGNPLPDADIKLKSVNLPRGHDLDKRIDQTRNYIPRMFSSGVGYRETVYRPWLIPGLETKTRSDTEGKFVFRGLPKDCIVVLEVSHPLLRTSRYTVAVRSMDPVRRNPTKDDADQRIVLYGSGNKFQPPAGVTVRGRVTVGLGIGGGSPAPAGVTVALANHNAKDGTMGEKVVTDAEGKFELTGLGPDYREPGYILAVIGSFDAPIESKRISVPAERESRIEVRAAVPYRLTLTDSDGQPIDREVYSITVQRKPDQLRRGATDHYDRAVRVGPGLYEGIVPQGPGAVMVKRGGRRDRPAWVEPKAFFEPGRDDWTADEHRYAYGDSWQITQPGITTTDGLSPARNRMHSQLNMAAVILTNGIKNAGQPLELSATVYRDTPPSAELRDLDGQPVAGANVVRQLSKYGGKDLPTRFKLHGLHPKRAEWIRFTHPERNLIGTLKATLPEHAGDPIKVVMKPKATLRGRIVDSSGEATRTFVIRLEGAIAPYKHIGNRSKTRDSLPKGTFEIDVMPDEEYSGRFMRLTYRSSYPRPLLGKAFGPVKPKPGEVIDLGDMQVTNR